MIELPIRVAAPDMTHVDGLACGTRLAEFEILGLIGVGGFGMVYRAYDHSLQRDVAIKEFLPTAMAGRAADQLTVTVRASTDLESFQTGLQSFVGEARMLAMFEHPSLVRVFRFWEANGTAYMVMPLYRGMTLKQARLCMRTPPTEVWLRRVMWSILGALKVLHRGQALHRDVSPDNIFLQDSGPPVLLDLGAARLALGDTDKQHTAILKVNYAPIEQHAGAHELPQGPWTDLYALCAVVHGVLSNQAPLPATIRAVHDRMPAFANVVKTVRGEFGQHYSDQFVECISWGLKIQPQDRPQSVRDFVRRLGLSTPIGMSSFDWRAELGPACLPVGDVLRLSDSATIENQTRPSNRDPDYAPTQFIGEEGEDSTPDDGDATFVAKGNADDAPSSKPLKYPDTHAKHTSSIDRVPVLESESVGRRKKPSRHGRKSNSPAGAMPRSSVVLVVGAVVLSILFAVGWAWRSANTKSRKAQSAASMVLTDAVGPVAAVASAPVAPASDLPPQQADAAQVPASAPLANASAPDASAKPAAPARARSASAPGRTKKPEPARAPVIAEPPPPAPVVAAEPPKPEPKPAPPPPTPDKLCADSSFFGRPMCMYRACQRADLVGTPACIELEQRFKRDTEGSKN